MTRAQFVLVLVAYAFVVGHFNLFVGIAAALVMWVAFQRHGEGFGDRV